MLTRMDSLVIAPPILCGDDPPDRTLIIETRVERVHAHKIGRAHV